MPSLRTMFTSSGSPSPLSSGSPSSLSTGTFASPTPALSASLSPSPALSASPSSGLSASPSLLASAPPTPASSGSGLSVVPGTTLNARPNTSSGSVRGNGDFDEEMRRRMVGKRSMPSLKALFSSHSTLNLTSPASSSNPTSSSLTSPPPPDSSSSSSPSVSIVLPSQVIRHANQPTVPPPSPSFLRLRHRASKLLLRTSAPRTSSSNKRYTPSLPAELWLLILRYACMPPYVKPGSGGAEYLVDPFDPFYSQLGVSTPSSGEERCIAAADDHESLLTSTPTHASFLTTPSSTLLHTHFSARLSAYDQLVKWKAGLCRVSREWRDVGQVLLWEDVWIGRGREGRRVAGRLGGDAGLLEDGVVVCGGGDREKEKEKERARMAGKEKGKGIGRGKGLKVLMNLFNKDVDVSRRRDILPASTTKTTTTTPPDQTQKRSFTSLSRASTSSYYKPTNPGTFIKRLHIETMPLDKCSPHDLLLILQHCPNLEVFEDWRSVRRAMFRLVVGGDERVPFVEGGGMGANANVGVGVGSGAGANAGVGTGSGAGSGMTMDAAKTDAILYALLYPAGGDRGYGKRGNALEGRARPLKRVCWTNYDYDVGDFERGVEVWRGIEGLGGVGCLSDGGVGCLSDGVGMMNGMKGKDTNGGRGGSAGGLKGLERVGKELEVLEICLLGGDVDLSERRRRREEERRAVRYHQRRGESSTSVIVAPTSLSELLSSSSLGMGVHADLLTTLELELQTGSMSASSSLVALQAAQAQAYTLTLPALISLKATLDNATFFILSTWDLPLLRNLSVIAADFGYAGRGFKRFFEVHGEKVRQLELGHSSGQVEEWWIVGGQENHHNDPHHHHHHQQQQPLNPHANPNNVAPEAMTPFAIPLNEYCPNLLEFICCADAEWNWRSPDWIAPHVLMPRHEGLEIIGVRGLERRLEGDLGEAVGRRGGDVGVGVGVMGGPVIPDGQDDDEVGDDDDDEDEGGGRGGERGGSGMTLRTALRVRGLREDPYFMLLQQFGSLLRREAFPGLLKVRDMSPESDFVRRVGRMGAGVGSGDIFSGTAFGPSSSSSKTSASSPSTLGRTAANVRTLSTSNPRTANPKKKMTREEVVAQANGRIVSAFWERVVERCEVRGVELEDWRGGEVRREHLGFAM